MTTHTVKCRFQKTVNLEVYFQTMSSNTAFEIPLVVGDTGPVLRINLLEALDTPILVSGAGQVNFYMRRFQKSPHTNLGNEACDAVDVANGIWDYHFGAGDVSGGAGTYFGDVEIIFDDGTKETAFEAVRFLVRDNNKA